MKIIVHAAIAASKISLYIPPKYGLPAVNHEMSGDKKEGPKAGPLELNLSHVIDKQKGCYLVSNESFILFKKF